MTIRNSLTVELILILPPDPAGIARTMQANSDLSSRRAGPVIFSGFRKFDGCAEKMEASGKAITLALQLVASPELTGWLDVSDGDVSVPGHGCSVVKP